ncbi:Protein kinase domain-containing protein [Plasmodiophora brassicae]|uniref:Protein kinase domain-containing protein n=1 Tax=Plasmodiophora brassicae TaxID=37360 RepID=A0A0G4IXL7_PLABS|nr:hypothetical protein PBRA_007827 [Plasmodiophora brassicae]SPR00216.1 unnamed protein product [Plasmodiophora brassicae]
MIALLLLLLLGVFATGIARRSDEKDIDMDELVAKGVADAVERHHGVVIGEHLGSGGFGSAFTATSTSDPSDRYAVKFVRAVDDHDRKNFDDECASNMAITAYVENAGPGQHLATCRSCFVLNGYGVLIMRLYPGTLRDIVKNLTTPEVYRIGAEIARALDTLHARLAIVHLDLKVSNVFLDEDHGVHLADFGVSVRLDRPDQRVRMPKERSAPGTRGYKAPEVLLKSDQVGTPADMYGFGALLHNILLRRTSWARSSTELDQWVNYGRKRDHARKPRLPEVLCIDTGLCPLIEQCLSWDPDQRPTAREAAATLEALANPSREVLATAPTSSWMQLAVLNIVLALTMVVVALVTRAYRALVTAKGLRGRRRTSAIKFF